MWFPQFPDDSAKALLHNSTTAKRAIIKILIRCFIINEFIDWFVFQISVLLPNAGPSKIIAYGL